MNIALIGMMSVGKTTIGKALARELGYRFIDIDHMIEEKENIGLQHLIDSKGESYFREIEENTVLGLDNLENCIISTGGSIIYSPNAMGCLKKFSKVVFLYDSFENIRKRLTNEKTRGIIGLKGKTLEQLFDERQILYRKYAGFTVEVPDGFNVEKVVQDISAYARQKGI